MNSYSTTVQSNPVALYFPFFFVSVVASELRPTTDAQRSALISQPPPLRLDTHARQDANDTPVFSLSIAFCDPLFPLA